MDGLQQKMIAVIGGLKAPKGQYNGFGKYKYRSCEDILEALKPLLVLHGLLLTISDDILMVGNRIYVKATATVSCGGESISNTAFAREEDTKKGMDASQVTGAASSYARKYALNGLFCIDDTKDSDATNTGDSDDENPLLEVALADIKAATSVDALKAVWNNYDGLKSDPRFKQAVNARKEALK